MSHGELYSSDAPCESYAGGGIQAEALEGISDVGLDPAGGCKRRVDAGDPDAEGASWADYCRVHFPDYSLSQNGKLLHLASQPDLPGTEDAFDRVWAGFMALDRKRQTEFMRCAAAYVARSKDSIGRSASAAVADLPNVVDRLA